MKHYTKLASIITLLTFHTSAFAFFCPTNFSQIDFGMTTEQVTEACGKPDSQKESTKENANVPQEWTYFVPQTVSTGGSQNMQGTLKSSISFDDQGKAINISVNGIGVGATSICSSAIQLGDTQDKVKAACGTPANINKQDSSLSGGQQQPPTKIVEFIYSSASPAATLVFENGVLTDKK
jgi:hypothetical protein